MPKFDQLADMYWQLGVMQSPSQLQGYLVGRLAAGDELQPESWPARAAAYIDAVQAPDLDGEALLTALLAASALTLSSEDMTFQLLLPDDAEAISQRVDSLGQWCQGFIAGFAEGGKRVQQQHGQQQYSQQVSEALSDLAAISQISLTEEDGDVEQGEQHFFELSEYLRLAAMTVYLDCRQQAITAADSNTAAPAESAAGQTTNLSPAGLFSGQKNKLH
jgi:uncharacterized protein YgfB (UPF0149 family)